MRITVVYTDTQFSEPITYTFGLILSILGIEHEILSYSDLTVNGVHTGDMLISYGCRKIDANGKCLIHIYQSKLFGRDYKTLSSMPLLPLKHWDALPVIYEGNGVLGSLVVRSGNLIESNIDIIASAFFMLSRYEETVVNEKDQYDRFPATASIAYKEDFLTRPIVNEYVALLWEWIDSFNLGFRRKKLWNGKDFALCLTHDVDAVRKYHLFCPPLFSVVRAIARKHDMRRAFSIISDHGKTLLRLKRDPYDNFEWIMDLEERYGFRSAFYFLADRGFVSASGYSIQSNRLRKLIGTIKEKEFEVGLHVGFGSYRNVEQLKLEKDRLEEASGLAISGGRSHYLKWHIPESWRNWEMEGFEYDTTLGFADREGFRCGICVPYRPFDIVENREINVFELPLIVMDTTLYGYQHLSPEDGLQRVERLVDIVEKYNGVFVLLWHNSSFYELQVSGWPRVYEEILDYIAQRRVINYTAQETIACWRDYIAGTRNE